MPHSRLWPDEKQTFATFRFWPHLAASTRHAARATFFRRRQAHCFGHRRKGCRFRSANLRHCLDRVHHLSHLLGFRRPGMIRRGYRPNLRLYSWCLHVLQVKSNRAACAPL